MKVVQYTTWHMTLVLQHDYISYQEVTYTLLKHYEALLEFNKKCIPAYSELAQLYLCINMVFIESFTVFKNWLKSQLCTLLTIDHFLTLYCSFVGLVDEHEVEQLSSEHGSMLMCSNHFLTRPVGWKLCSITFTTLLDYKPAISWYYFWMLCSLQHLHTPIGIFQLLLIWAHFWNMVLLYELVHIDCQKKNRHT